MKKFLIMALVLACINTGYPKTKITYNWRSITVTGAMILIAVDRYQRFESLNDNIDILNRMWNGLSKTSAYFEQLHLLQRDRNRLRNQFYIASGLAGFNFAINFRKIELEATTSKISLNYNF